MSVKFHHCVYFISGECLSYAHNIYDQIIISQQVKCHFMSHYQLFIVIKMFRLITHAVNECDLPRLVDVQFWPTWYILNPKDYKTADRPPAFWCTMYECCYLFVHTSQSRRHRTVLQSIAAFPHCPVFFVCFHHLQQRMSFVAT